MRRLARALSRDDSQADDLAQDACVAALERPPKSALAMPRWLATVIRRLALDERRARSRREEREARAARSEAQGSDEAALERLEVGRLVLDQVLALREPYRTAVYLRYWEDVEPAEIAARLGVPVKTIKTRLARALAELRVRLDSNFGGERHRWLSALLPFALPRELVIANPTASAVPSPTLVAAGAAAGALIVKKLFLVLAVAGIALLAWRVTHSEVDGVQPDPSAGTIEASLVASAQPAEPPTPLAEPASASVERAVATPAATETAGPTTGSLIVHLRWPDGTDAVDVSIDASCKADPAPREEWFRARTDGTGRARFPELFAGGVRVVVDRGANFEAEVVAGEEREVEFVFPAGLTVEGRVIGPAGEPVAGAEIWVEGLRHQWNRAHRVALSASDGSFQISGLAESAQLGAWAVGFLPSLVYDVGNLPRGLGEAREVTLELGVSGASVAGRVVDPSGNPVPGALVKVGPRGGSFVDLPNGQRADRAEPVPVETDPNGHFVYPGDVDAGPQPVHVSARGRPHWQSIVEVRPDETTRVEVVLGESARVEGRVVDANGRPVEGVTVVASVEWSGGWHFDEFPPSRAQTDAEGRFHLDWVPPGEQQLNASDARRPEFGRAKVRVLCEGGRTANVELVLDLGSTIAGRVVDTQRRPLAGWRIHARDDPTAPIGTAFNAHPRQANTDEQGHFLVANLDGEHHYWLQARPAGEFLIRPRAEARNVAPGTTDLELVVDTRVADASFRGRLLGQDGRVPTDLRVVHYAEGGDTGGYIDVEIDTGRFEKRSLLPGRYELRVYRGGQTIHRTEVFDLLPGETKDIGTLVPGDLGRAEILFTGKPPDDLAKLHPQLNREGHASEQLTLEAGVFRSRALTPGEWRVEFFGPWFVRKAAVPVRAGKTVRTELAIEPAHEVTVVCVCADPSAKWTRLDWEVRDERGDLVRRAPSWFRGSVVDGKVQLYPIALPAGRYWIDAWTDTNLRGSISIEVGPQIEPSKPPHTIVLR